MLRVSAPVEIPAGTCVSGLVDGSADRPTLADIRVWIVPPGEGGERPVVSLKARAQSRIWRIADDIEVMSRAHPTVASLLNMALDALANGAATVGAALLIEATRSASDSLAADLRARLAVTAFQVLDELKLQRMAPPLWEVLPNSTRSAVGIQSRDDVDRIVKLGNLRSHLESPERTRREFEGRVRHERGYQERLAARLPIVRQALRRFIELLTPSATWRRVK